MKQHLILWPLIAQTILILLLFVRLGQLKDRARAAGKVDLTLTALDNDAWPDDVRKVANNIRTQFQIPVLFFVLVLALYAHGAVDGWARAFAWAFVASRIAHSYVHIGSNYVPRRTLFFKLSVLFVFGLLFLLIRAQLT